MSPHRSPADHYPRGLRRVRTVVLGVAIAATGIVLLQPQAALAQGAAGSGPQGDSPSPPLVTSPPPASPPGGSATPPAIGAPGAASMQCGPVAMQAGMGRGLAAADEDHDGRVSRGEFLRFHEAIFDRMPKDRDGQVRLDELMRQRGDAAPARRPDRAPAPPSRNISPAREDRGNDAGETADRAPGKAEAASSSQSAPASTPSSAAPQESKPGRRGDG